MNAQIKEANYVAITRYITNEETRKEYRNWAVTFDMFLQAEIPISAPAMLASAGGVIVTWLVVDYRLRDALRAEPRPEGR
jgi:hypothetical protein